MAIKIASDSFPVHSALEELFFMSSFAMYLLEGGVDLEVAVDFDQMTSILDEEVARYSCEDYAYNIRPVKGKIGSRWTFVISAYDPKEAWPDMIPLGKIEIEPMDAGLLDLCVPPRSEQAVPGADAADWDGKLFSSFIFQLLNSLSARKMVDLPGVLPIV
jgi:hypothetical protein